MTLITRSQGGYGCTSSTLRGHVHGRDVRSSVLVPRAFAETNRWKTKTNGFSPTSIPASGPYVQEIFSFHLSDLVRLQTNINGYRDQRWYTCTRDNQQVDRDMSAS